MSETITDVSAHIRGVIANVLEVEVGTVDPAHHFVNDLGANSLDVVEFVMRLEEDLDISIPDDAADKIETVGDLVRFCVELRDGKSTAIASSVAIASDRAGYELKGKLIAHMVEAGVEVNDLGPETDNASDYPEFAAKVANAIASGEARYGILVCGTGIGMAIAANKVAGIRAATVHNTYEARMAREHNDANVLCIGARVIGEGQATEALNQFLTTEFTPGDDGRHRRRVDMIKALEGDSSR